MKKQISFIRVKAELVSKDIVKCNTVRVYVLFKRENIPIHGIENSHLMMGDAYFMILERL